MGGMSSIWQPTASTGREPAWVDDLHLRLAREECCEPDIAEWGFHHDVMRTEFPASYREGGADLAGAARLFAALSSTVDRH
jgi:hypothetical protein